MHMLPWYVTKFMFGSFLFFVFNHLLFSTHDEVCYFAPIPSFLPFVAADGTREIFFLGRPGK